MKTNGPGRETDQRKAAAFNYLMKNLTEVSEAIPESYILKTGEKSFYCDDVAYLFLPDHFDIGRMTSVSFYKSMVTADSCAFVLKPGNSYIRFIVRDVYKDGVTVPVGADVEPYITKEDIALFDALHGDFRALEELENGEYCTDPEI